MEAVDWDGHLTYLFGLSDGTVIDGAQGGNELRHLNHSCNPNCEAVEQWAEDGTLQLGIVVVRDVAAGEELCIYYALEIDESCTPESQSRHGSLSRCASRRRTCQRRVHDRRAEGFRGFGPGQPSPCWPPASARAGCDRAPLPQGR